MQFFDKNEDKQLQNHFGKARTRREEDKNNENNTSKMVYYGLGLEYQVKSTLSLIRTKEEILVEWLVLLGFISILHRV